MTNTSIRSLALGTATTEAENRFDRITDSSYDHYPKHWKEQSQGGAEYLISLLDERGVNAITKLDLSDPEVRSEYGGLIHDNWITRNEWVNHPTRGNPDLAKPFDELSDEEQQKDIDQLIVLQTWIAKHPLLVRKHYRL